MFRTYVASVLSGCCVCFAIVFKWFLGAFASVSDTFSSVSSVFRRMLQVLHLDVSKIDRVLHLPSFLLPRLSVSSSFQHRAGHPPPPRPLLDAGNVRGQRGPRMGA